VIKTISLGEGELITGITAVLGLAAFATVFFLTLHKWCLRSLRAIS